MIFKGVATALITPFNENGVDVDALVKLLDYQYRSGVDAVVVLGTTGEPATMTEKEKELTVSVAVNMLKGKIPVIVGAGSNSTQQAIATCKTAESLGADGLLVVTPYYNKCTQEGLLRHYGAICESTSLPVIAYNVASRTGVNMLPSTFGTLLCEHENLVGIKEASGNMEQIEQCLRLANGKASVISGDDALTVPITAMGGDGVISVASNVCPEYVCEMTKCALNGDMKKAAKMQLELLPLISALFCEVNPIPVKCAMKMLGYCNGKLRLPLTPLTSANEQKLKTLIDYFVKN